MTSVKEFYRKEFNEMTDLKKENIKLKDEIKHYKQIAQHHGDMSVKYTAKCVVYKQALQEIMKILDNSCKQCMNEFLNEDYCSEGDCFEIRQKINEVLNEQN